MEGEKSSKRTSRVIKVIAKFGVLFVSLLMVYLLAIPDEIDPRNYFRSATHTFYKRVAAQLEAPTLVLAGDSMIQGMAVREVRQDAYNFGIGTDTITGLNKRLEEYQLNRFATCIFLHVGVNDLLKGDTVESAITNYRKLLDSLPENIPVFVGELLPLDLKVDRFKLSNTQIKGFNRALAVVIEEYESAHIVKQYDLLTKHHDGLFSAYHIGDGLHLNNVGYRVWTNYLNQHFSNNLCVEKFNEQ